ncbi:MAG: RluA family pseudouridine synthase [Ruminococcaceae bacterium]|nr:RluA family pseudouridine synthase [Oscillospiraceae bacterium]
MREITVKKNDAGQRLDKFLTKAVKGLPTSMMYKLIRTKKIKVNRKRAEQKYILCEGDTVQLFIREEFFDSPEKDNGALSRIIPKLNILYEDENIMLLNKRPGVLVHEDTEGAENTLAMHLKAYLLQKGEYHPNEEQSFAPALCNRIDRNTGGIVIAAKNAEALRVMNEKIREGQISKFYLCLVHGIPKKKQDKLYAFLRKNAKDNTVEVRNAPFAGAKEIITGYRVIEERGDCSLLEVELFTGRTHQIRAQMAAIGHPLVGDGKYGVNREEKKSGYKYQALYSYKLHFKPTGAENLLSYLEGKTFSLDREDIWFVKEKQ